MNTVLGRFLRAPPELAIWRGHAAMPISGRSKQATSGGFHRHGDTPSSLDGSLHGKSQSKMDVLGVLPFMDPPLFFSHKVTSHLFIF